MKHTVKRFHVQQIKMQTFYISSVMIDTFFGLTV